MSTTINVSNDVTRIFEVTESITAAQTLTQADSGKVFWLDAAAGVTVTLPAVKDGLKLKFVLVQAHATTNWVIASATSANIQGAFVDGAAAAAAADEDQVNFVAGTAAVGDFVEFSCDGTDWFISGVCSATGGITATT